MSDKDNPPWWVIVVLSSACIFLGMWLGSLVASGVYSTSAIKAGVAEYQVNPKTGETRFVWITNAPSFKP